MCACVHCVCMCCACVSVGVHVSGVSLAVTNYLVYLYFNCMVLMMMCCRYIERFVYIIISCCR